MALIERTGFANYAAPMVERFTLLDIGCSGGIGEYWRVFDSKLECHGFDPSIESIELLRGSEKSPLVHYHSGFVIGDDPAQDSMPGRNPWNNLAICETRQIRLKRREAAADVDKATSGDWSLAALSSDKIHLPTFLRENSFNDVDFIKIDVDGHDFEILKSMKAAFSDYRVLGVRMEVNWIGSGNPNEHSFHNTDCFLRKCGFDLFGHETLTYSMAALPIRYCRAHPSDSIKGRPLQGDAVYLRDLTAPEMEKLAESYSADKLLKLAILFSMAHNPDSAAAILVKFRDRLSSLVDITQALDQLVVEAGWNNLTYQELRTRFEEDWEGLYNART